MFEVEMLYSAPASKSYTKPLMFIALSVLAFWSIFSMGGDRLDDVIIGNHLLMASIFVPTNLVTWALSIKDHVACLKLDLALRSAMQLIAIAMILASPWGPFNAHFVLWGLVLLIAGAGSYFACRRKIRNTFHSREASVN